MTTGRSHPRAAPACRRCGYPQRSGPGRCASTTPPRPSGRPAARARRPSRRRPSRDCPDLACPPRHGSHGTARPWSRRPASAERADPADWRGGLGPGSGPVGVPQQPVGSCRGCDQDSAGRGGDREGMGHRPPARQRAGRHHQGCPARELVHRHEGERVPGANGLYCRQQHQHGDDGPVGPTVPRRDRTRPATQRTTTTTMARLTRERRTRGCLTASPGRPHDDGLAASRATTGASTTTGSPTTASLVRRSRMPTPASRHANAATRRLRRPIDKVVRAYMPSSCTGEFVLPATRRFTSVISDTSGASGWTNAFTRSRHTTTLRAP